MSKASTGRRARELALQMLFQLDIAGQTPEEVRRTFWGERRHLDENVRDFADELFGVATERADEVNQIIERNARQWKLERMTPVDRNLLRTGVAELLHHSRTPAPIVINEAIEIARRFSTPESATFVNGVLDSVARELAGRDGLPASIRERGTATSRNRKSRLSEKDPDSDR